MSFLSFLGYVAAILAINSACVGVVAGVIWISEKPFKQTEIMGKTVSYTNA